LVVVDSFRTPSLQLGSETLLQRHIECGARHGAEIVKHYSIILAIFLGEAVGHTQQCEKDNANAKHRVSCIEVDYDMGGRTPDLAPGGILRQ
jgi:hypothetical protein